MRCLKSQQADELFDFALDKMSSIDLFVANAGVAYYEKLDQPDWEHIDAIFQTNVMSALYCAEKMKAIRGNQPFKFVVTASAMSLLSLPGYSLYSATKSAIRGFADAYRYELDEG